MVPLGIHLESTQNLVGLGSRWIRVNLVGMVGIWWEFGGNDSRSRWKLGGFSLTWYSYQIPTIPTIPPGIHSDSTWIQAEYVGEGKVLVVLVEVVVVLVEVVVVVEERLMVESCSKFMTNTESCDLEFETNFKQFRTCSPPQRFLHYHQPPPHHHQWPRRLLQPQQLHADMLKHVHHHFLHHFR